jgi:CRP-like cAMP-binding protein
MRQDQSQEVAKFAASIASAGGVIPPRIGGTMTVIEKILTLGRIPIFADLDTTALAHVSSCATEETFPAGAKIITEAEYGEHMFIIVDGSVEIEIGGTHLKNLSSMDFFGEMSMLDGGARSASVVALSDCLLLRIGKDDFEQLLSTYSSAALAVIRTLSKRLRDGDSLAAHA